MSEGRRALTSGDLWRIFFRSFFVQTVWNFQRIQNVGWLYSLWPALKRLYPDPAARGKIAVEHLEYFNTHPYMTNVIVGVVSGLEEDAAAGASRAGVHSAKKYMSGPLAALGDTIFWSALRPFLALAAFIAGMLCNREIWWIAPVFFLGSFNAFHLAVRGGGLLAGYRLKSKVIPFVTKFNIQRAAQAVYVLGMLLIGVAVFVVFSRMHEGRKVAAGILAASAAALFAGLPSSTLAYLVVIVSVAVSLWRWGAF
jgi:mannose/fructose/N-acetylgalactosamine-specific phosphotransferase system component IID